MYFRGITSFFKYRSKVFWENSFLSSSLSSSLTLFNSCGFAWTLAFIVASSDWVKINFGLRKPTIPLHYWKNICYIIYIMLNKTKIINLRPHQLRLLAYWRKISVRLCYRKLQSFIHYSRPVPGDRIQIDVCKIKNWWFVIVKI